MPEIVVDFTHDCLHGLPSAGVLTGKVNSEAGADDQPDQANNHDYTYGLRSVYRMLSREVVMPCDKKPKTYNILGASAGSFRIRSDVWVIQNLMREAFGYECSCVMGLECDVSELRDMGGPMGMGMMGAVKRKAALHGDYDTLLGFSHVLEELNIDLENAVCSHSLKAIESPDERIRFIPKEKERIELWKSTSGQ